MSPSRSAVEKVSTCWVLRSVNEQVNFLKREESNYKWRIISRFDDRFVARERKERVRCTRRCHRIGYNVRTLISRYTVVINTRTRVSIAINYRDSVSKARKRVTPRTSQVFPPCTLLFVFVLFPSVKMMVIFGKNYGTAKTASNDI